MSKISTQVTDFIFYEDNRYAKHVSLLSRLNFL